MIMKEYDITQEDIEQFKAMRECGCTLKQIQRMFKYPKSHSLYICKTLSKKYKRLKAQDRFLSAYNSGSTIAEIADDNGVSEHSVYCRLRFCGVQVPHKAYNTESIIQDLLDGVKQSEICKKYGVKRQWVSYCKKQYVEGRILNAQ